MPIPDRIVPMELPTGDVLNIMPAIDVLHEFKHLGTYVLHYIDSPEDAGSSLRHVYMTADAAKLLLKHIPELIIVPRTEEFELEWEARMDFEAGLLDDKEWGVDDIE